MSELAGFTNKKLVMAAAQVRVMAQEEGLAQQSFQEGALSHLYSALTGLLGEVLASHQLAVAPISPEQAQLLLKQNNVHSGLAEEILHLAHDGWGRDMLRAYAMQQSFNTAAQMFQGGETLIARFSDGHPVQQDTVTVESLKLWQNAMQELIQNIRGQMQEW
ncbi:DUF6586 family protein [Parendozoicomonas haliclonae]|uniref:PasA protein n=1 Tax=Parendozoicomonas haliclonae TaxID=1960125 RepID=A0A1X7AKY2_9GAMM|nr:DUF6586 family protein [Parendozoicomonas haliclonae]SMA47752.1 hypothetical protein EHSB41UT_02543 [Parendozoicomonas haliclonae]